MKWPSHIIIIRHGQSAYNALGAKKRKDPEYIEFVKEFEKDFQSKRTKELAALMRKRYALGFCDYKTPLSDEGWDQAYLVARGINNSLPRPDVVYVSPYLRTKQTLTGMSDGGLKVGTAKIVQGEDRIREQEHGLSLLYSDWRTFQVMHPEQRELHELLGRYWYQFPQGESVSMVRDRVRSFMTTLIRECPGQVVYLVSHHLTKLAIRANLERLTPEEFIDLDNHDKPINCGVTHYRCDLESGTNGRLKLVEYNMRLY